MTPRLRRLWRRTEYRVADGIRVEIGRRSAAVDRFLAGLGVRRACLLTSANPRSRRLADGSNDRRLRALEARLRVLPHAPAEGRLGRWREAGFAVGGDPRRLERLAARFGQHAVVALARGLPARVVVLPRHLAPRDG